MMMLDRVTLVVFFIVFMVDHLAVGLVVLDDLVGVPPLQIFPDSYLILVGIILLELSHIIVSIINMKIVVVILLVDFHS